MSQSMIDRLRDRSYGSKAKDPLCEEAADEIARLLVVLSCYAQSSAAAAKEIAQLRLSLEKLEDKCAEYRATVASFKARVTELEHRIQGQLSDDKVRVAE